MSLGDGIVSIKITGLDSSAEWRVIAEISACPGGIHIRKLVSVNRREVFALVVFIRCRKIQILGRLMGQLDIDILEIHRAIQIALGGHRKSRGAIRKEVLILPIATIATGTD